jgi:hypothetical protein
MAIEVAPKMPGPTQPLRDVLLDSPAAGQGILLAFDGTTSFASTRRPPGE